MFAFICYVFENQREIFNLPRLGSPKAANTKSLTVLLVEILDSASKPLNATTHHRMQQPTTECNNPHTVTPTPIRSSCWPGSAWVQIALARYFLAVQVGLATN